MKLIRAILCAVMAVVVALSSVSCSGELADVMDQMNGRLPKEGQAELLVIMYHKLTQSQKYVNEYNILVSQFERDLMYLRDNGYETVTSDQIFDFVYSGKQLPEKSVMITFDDGFRGVYVYAYPLLKQYGMTAVVNVVGAYTEQTVQSGDNNILYAYLSWEEIIELSQSGVFEIGNHTYDMHSMRSDTSQRAGCAIMKNESEEHYRQSLREDVGQLQDILFEKLGYYPYLFAYPFGLKCSEAEKVLEDMSFKVAFNCEEKMNVIDQSGQSMLSLNRFNRSGNITTDQFFNKCLK